MKASAVRAQKYLAALRVDFSAPIPLLEDDWLQLYDGLVLLLAEHGITQGHYRVEISTSKGGWHESID